MKISGGGTSRKVMISDIQEVVFGQRTEKFKRNNRPELVSLSFSLIYTDGNSKESLDLVCKDEKEFQTWTGVLNTLVERKLTPEQLGQYKVRVKEYLVEKAQPGQEQEENVSDVVSFGWNQWGQTGADIVSVDVSSCAPTLVKSLLGKGVTHAAAGWAHSSVITETGELIQFGNMVGTHLETDALSPVPVPLNLSPRVELAQVSCGAHHSAALTVDGHLLTWGANLYGQLGHGHCNDVRTPTIVQKLVNTHMDLELFLFQVACAANATAAVGEDGNVYTWGSGAHGTLAHNDTQDRSTPEMVRDLSGSAIIMIAAGDCHMMACTETDTYSWGWNAAGQLGLEHEEDQLRPHIVESLRGKKVLSIGCGAAHTLAAVETVNKKAPSEFVTGGALYAWGSNQQGQLGLGKTKKENIPTLVAIPGDPKVAQVACGAMHSCIASADLKVWSAGDNRHGQLGHRAKQELDTFVALPTSGAMKGREATLVVCGGMHSIILCPRAWVSDDATRECMDCKKAFTFSVRKHHCRNCGGIFCHQCSAKKFAILSSGSTKPLRVCNKCYKQLGGR